MSTPLSVSRRRYRYTGQCVTSLRAPVLSPRIPVCRPDAAARTDSSSKVLKDPQERVVVL